MNTVRETIDAVLAGTLRYEAGLDALTVAPALEADPVLLAALHECCARLWRSGWQPGELHRLVARRSHPTHPQLITDALAEYLRGFAPAAVDERWREQVQALDADLWWDPSAGYLGQLAARRRLDRVAVLDAVLTLLGVLTSLPPIEVLLPPPGTVVSPGSGRRAVDDRLLERVRALLAKAEATGYPAEAEAYTAKAQQLIARHSIDEAVLRAGAGDSTVVPFARRIGVDPPYEAEKAALLDAVARANRCHLVWSPEFGFATVFGFDADIDAVDLLHTSLLVQAHRAMARTEPPSGKSGRARLKSFRQSFLVAFAARIGERLAGAAEAALAESAGTGSGLLPVLASRDEQVRESMQAVFPRTVRARGARVDSLEGWDSGRAAADHAGLRADQPAGSR